MKIAILTGTRPDIIKMAPVYLEAKKRRHDVALIHTMQHYPFHLYEGVYKDLDLPFPAHYSLNYNLTKKVGLNTSRIAYHIDEKSPNLKLYKKIEKVGMGLARPDIAKFVGETVIALGKLFRTGYKPDILLTHGDTLTCMAGSLAANLNLVPVGHVEAGLRTFCKEPFPEQTDTRVADACSDLYFAATETNKKNLLNEGFPKERVFVVGNTVVDVAKWAMKKGEKSRKFFEKHGFDFSRKLVYVSCHRRENLMHRQRFEAVAGALCKLSERGYQVLWSIRPGTLIAIKQYNLEKKIKQYESLILVGEIPNYTDMMFFVSKCKFIMTDSGSMQEESAALHIPCITLRYVTDRPESVEAGVNILAPPKSAESICAAIKKVERENSSMRKKKNPYGEGNSSKLILNAIENFRGKAIVWEHEKKK